jgi:hypothetical protein
VTYNTEESDFTEMGSLPVIKRIAEDDGETAEEEEEIPEDESEDPEPVWNQFSLLCKFVPIYCPIVRLTYV